MEQGVLFGSFSEEEVSNLFKDKVPSLHFVWREKTGAKRCALYRNNLTVQKEDFGSGGGYTPGVLSPNIPPNPPTSPVEGTCDMLSRGLASKLNVNAMPFVPAAISVIDSGSKNSSSTTKNRTAQPLEVPKSNAESSNSDALPPSTNSRDKEQLPGVVVQTIGESSSSLTLESNSRTVQSDSHSTEQISGSTSQQVTANSSTISEHREQSNLPPTEVKVDRSSTEQSSDSQRTQPCSTVEVRSSSSTCSVSSDTERQHGDVASNPPQRTSGESRSQTHSPTPSPSSPSHTPTPSQTNESSLQTLSDQAKSDTHSPLPQQPGQSHPPVQSNSLSASPASVSSLSTTSAISTGVSSTSGSCAAGSGGVKIMSWASIVSKSSSQPAGQVSQTGLTSSPQVQASGGVTVSKKSKEVVPGDSTANVAMVADNRPNEGGAWGISNAAQEQSPPFNPVKSHAELANLGSQLMSWKIDHTPVSIQPRGLINQGNWCYMHAPLQAMLSCPAVYNLLHSFSPFPALSKDPAPTPVTNTIVQFMHEFRPYPKVEPPPQPAASSLIKKKRQRAELHHGDPFRPLYVYEMLSKISSTLSTRGRQEDAEEFLGCLLDKLHGEMIAAKKAFSEGNREEPADDDSDGRASKEAEPSDSTASKEGGEDEEHKEDAEWEQVGPKNKSTITRQTSFLESPITEIFGGELRSAVHRHGAKESATVEPFFSLQLDIQSENIWTVKDALEALSIKETVRMSEVDAHKRITIARLPPILILHLKRFVFNLTGGSQKLQKHVQYDINLEVGKELLSPLIRNKLSASQRSYKLWAVVYHHGKTATGGHYTADVYHPVSGGWVRADDSLIRAIPEDFVLKPGGSAGVNKVAYLLIYRRRDTIA